MHLFHIFLILLDHLLPLLLINIPYFLDCHKTNLLNIMINLSNIKRLSAHKNLFILLLIIIIAAKGVISENACQISRPIWSGEDRFGVAMRRLIKINFLICIAKLNIGLGVSWLHNVFKYYSGKGKSQNLVKFFSISQQQNWYDSSLYYLFS